VIASLLDGGHAESIAQRVEDGHPGIELEDALLTIDRERDGQ
jgi:hypothetical protein